MPFLMAKAPGRRGIVSAANFRAWAAARDCERTGSPAVFWLKRESLLRRGAVDHPYLTPRFAIKGRSASGRIKLAGKFAQLTSSLGAILRGLNGGRA
jgi:hypothetical protein